MTERLTLAMILAALPGLSAEELQQLAGHVQLLRQHQTRQGPGSVDDDDATMVLRTLTETLTHLGIEFTPPAVLRSSSQFPAFRRKVPALMTYLAQAGQQYLVQRALLITGIELLVAVMQRRGTLVSARSVMNEIHRLPGVIGKSFPGYAEAGLLKCIVHSG